MSERRLTITIDFPEGDEPYVLSMLGQIEGMASDLILAQNQPNAKELTALGVKVRLEVSTP